MIALEDLSPTARVQLGAKALAGHQRRRQLPDTDLDRALVDLLVCLEEFMAQEDLPSDEIYNAAHARVAGVVWPPPPTPAAASNRARADAAAVALNWHTHIRGTETQPRRERLGDLLTDLRHLAWRWELPFEELLRASGANYQSDLDVAREADKAPVARDPAPEQAAVESWRQRQAAAVPPPPTGFVPGDWVRIAKPGTYSDGVEGLVLTATAAQVDIRPRGGKGTTALVPATDLLLVARRQQPPPAPQVGDQVIVVEAGNRYYGRKGTVSWAPPDDRGGLRVELGRRKAVEWFAQQDLVLYKTAAELDGAGQTETDKGAL